MIAQWTKRSRGLHWSSCWGVLLLAVPLIVLLALPAASQGPLRAQPVLLSIVAAHPDAIVSVIVQKQVRDSSIEELATRLGGQITLDLHIINAFGARIPARSIPELARAAGVRWISLDAPMTETACTPCVSSSALKSAYIRAIKADQVWNRGPAYLQGQGIGVAVVDSGIQTQQDLYTSTGQNRLVASVAFNNGYNTSVFDGYGHGNHVAGIIGGNGGRSGGAYMGVAPMVNLINVKVSDDQGASTTSNVVSGLQWIYENKDRYNIRVVNISLNSSAAASYHTDPLDAAVEILWFNKIVVVVSSGNVGKNALYPPANDPFVITVGAVDDRGTASTTDDVLAKYSGYGTTESGYAKPDLVAPGSNLISLMANRDAALVKAHPVNVVDAANGYFRMSGTSMAAPVVTGAVALLLQDEPNLTPDQVKYRLRATARPFDQAQRAGAGYLDVNAAVLGATTQSANTGIPASKMLWTGSTPLQWNSANWNSANWNTANWSTANWSSDSWD